MIVLIQNTHTHKHLPEAGESFVFLSVSHRFSWSNKNDFQIFAISYIFDIYDLSKNSYVSRKYVMKSKRHASTIRTQTGIPKKFCYYFLLNHVFIILDCKH